MEPPRSYKTPGALRRALEDRLRDRAVARGEDLARLRLLVSFDRVLARLFSDADAAPWIVKGGFGLEARYRMSARATKDLDLSIPTTRVPRLEGVETVEVVLDRLQAAVERDLDDGFVVRIGAPSQSAFRRSC